jgi:hypothetical protein
MKIGEKNVSSMDKAIRAVAAIIVLDLIAIGFVTPPVAYVGLVFGLVLLSTAAYNTCPVYSMLGISTCTMKSKKK